MKAIQYLFSVIFAFYNIVRIPVLENSNGQKTLLIWIFYFIQAQNVVLRW
jgi:hypothetical protein